MAEKERRERERGREKEVREFYEKYTKSSNIEGWGGGEGERERPCNGCIAPMANSREEESMGVGRVQSSCTNRSLHPTFAD